MMRELGYGIGFLIFIYVYFQFIEPNVMMIFERLAGAFWTETSKNEYLSLLETIKIMLRITIIIFMIGAMTWLVRRATRKEPSEKYVYYP